MPQLIVLALVGAGLYAGYRWFSRTTKEVAAEMRRTEEELRRRRGRHRAGKGHGRAGIRSGQRRLPPQAALIFGRRELSTRA